MTNNQILKMGYGYKQITLKREVLDVWETLHEMINYIGSYPGNAKQNYFEISSPTQLNGEEQ